MARKLFEFDQNKEQRLDEHQENSKMIIIRKDVIQIYTVLQSTMYRYSGTM